MNNVTLSVKNRHRRTPSKFKKVSDALKYFFVSAIGVITVSNFIEQGPKDWVVFSLTMTILLLRALDMGLGYKEEPK